MTTVIYTVLEYCDNNAWAHIAFQVVLSLIMVIIIATVASVVVPIMVIIVLLIGKLLVPFSVAIFHGISKLIHL